MDEKVKNDEKKVMLVRQTGEGQDGKLKAVGSIDEDGNIKTLDPTAANVAKLFDVHTNQPALEAFFTKFMEQSQDPVKTGVSEIFIMAESVLNKLIKIDLDPQLRIEVDFDEFVQHAFGHDEDLRDTRFYRVLRLLHEFGEKRLQSRLIRVHVEQFGDICRSGIERLDVSVFVDTADGLQFAVLTFSGLPDEHYLLLVVLYFFVHLYEILG